MAPRARFELATLRLTAECSTIELPGNREGRIKGYRKKFNEPESMVSNASSANLWRIQQILEVQNHASDALEIVLRLAEVLGVDPIAFHAE